MRVVPPHTQLPIEVGLHPSLPGPLGQPLPLLLENKPWSCSYHGPHRVATTVPTVRPCHADPSAGEADGHGGAVGWSAEGKTLVPVPWGQDKKPAGRHSGPGAGGAEQRWLRTQWAHPWSPERCL